MILLVLKSRDWSFSSLPRLASPSLVSLMEANLSRRRDDKLDRFSSPSSPMLVKLRSSSRRAASLLKEPSPAPVILVPCRFSEERASQAFEVGQALVGDRGAAQVQGFQGGDGAQVHQAGIAHLGTAQQQFLEFLQTFQMGQAGVGDPGALQLQGTQFGQLFKLAQFGVALICPKRRSPTTGLPFPLSCRALPGAGAEGFEGFRFAGWLGGAVGLFSFPAPLALREEGEQGKAADDQRRREEEREITSMSAPRWSGLSRVLRWRSFRQWLSD